MRPSIGKAVTWGLILGILIGWIPVIGPLVAGTVAGRKARTSTGAVMATVLPSALIASAFVWLSRHPIQGTVIGEIAVLAPITAACMIGAALVSARPGFGRLAGLIAVTGGLVWVGIEAPEIWNVGKIARDLVSRPASSPEKNKTCSENLSELWKAALNYAEGHDQKLPPAEKWLDEIKPYVTKDEWLHCPVIAKSGGAKFGYAMNPELSGKNPDSVTDKAKTALFYDSTDTAGNAHAGLESLPKPGRHGGRNNIVYLDGHVEAVAP